LYETSVLPCFSLFYFDLNGMRKTALLFFSFFAITHLSAQISDTLLFDTLRTAEIRATRLPVMANENVLSVTRLGTAQLRTAQAQLSLAESLGAVPGVFTMGDANFSQDLRISIRGFGARAGFGIRGIKVLLDGIPESAPDGQAQVDNLDMAAISRLEVLRGASGGLWGNASGGVLSLSTDDPPAENGQGFIAATFRRWLLWLSTNAPQDRCSFGECRNNRQYYRSTPRRLPRTRDPACTADQRQNHLVA
jgi:iron complex outermembrane receptor protein